MSGDNWGEAATEDWWGKARDAAKHSTTQTQDTPPHTHTPQQGIIWPKMPTVQLLRNPVLEFYKCSENGAIAPSSPLGGNFCYFLWSKARGQKAGYEATKESGVCLDLQEL